MSRVVRAMMLFGGLVAMICSCAAPAGGAGPVGDVVPPVGSDASASSDDGAPPSPDAESDGERRDAGAPELQSRLCAPPPGGARPDGANALGRPGAPCREDEDCVGGSRCDEHRGTCGPTKGAGDTCSGDLECPAETVCRSTAPSADPTCLPPGGTGAPCSVCRACAVGLSCVEGPREALCSDGFPGSPCDGDTDCAPPYICGSGEPTGACESPDALGNACVAKCQKNMHCNLAYPSALGGHCQPLGGFGALCTAASDCKDPYHCQPSVTAGQPATCRPLGMLAEPCWVDKDCWKTLRCSATGTAPGHCVPPITEGDSCELFWGCGGGLVCVTVAVAPAANVCSTGAPGQPCSDDEDCTDGLVCNKTTYTVAGGRCAAPGQPGDPCANAADCAAGQGCSKPNAEGTCALSTDEGFECHTTADCPPGLVCSLPVDGLAWKMSCRPPAQVGEPCTATAGCKEGLECSGYFGDKACLAGMLAPCDDDGDCEVGLACTVSLGGIDWSCFGPGEDVECCTVAYDSVGKCYLPYCAWFCSQLVYVPCGQCTVPDGSRQDGEPCGREEDCADGLGCLHGPEGNVCTPHGAPGAHCNTDAHCLAGLVCAWDPDTGSRFCQEPTPVLGACVNGTSCGLDQSCSGGICQDTVLGACEADEDCGAGRHCAKSVGGVDGSCTVTDEKLITSVSEACADGCTSDCVSYKRGCAPTYTVITPIACSQCIPDEGTQAAGEVCVSDSSCVTGLSCRSSHTCGLLGAEHAPCGVVSDCEVGLLCVLETCEQLGGAGAPCGVTGDCAAPLVCNTPLATCEPVGSSGAPCGSLPECSPGLVCTTFGVCGSKGLDGTPCGSNGDCLPGLECTGTTSSPGVCGATSGLDGAPCTEDADCLTPFCEAGLCTGFCD